MGNLTLRERAMMALVALFGVILLVYIFGIRPLNDSYIEMTSELSTLQAQKAYYDQLRLNNAQSASDIENLNEEITTYERSFIASLKVENLENYVMSKMEENGNPFLDSITSENIAMEPVQLPDGSASADTLQCTRITVVYATTDGYEITQYNDNPLIIDHGVVDTAVLSNIVNNTGKLQPEGAYGYEEFLAALNDIANDNDKCIKVSSLKAESTYGYMTLTATIDFFGTNLTNRVSAATDTNAYATWKGRTNVDTEGGFIGMPYIVRNEASAWNGVTMDDNEVSTFADRPFASYMSNAIFTNMLRQNGLKGIVGSGIVAATQTSASETSETSAE